ncbi:MAG: acyl-ACP--UDP-N-acetylglucosamine O-acyltransferase [Myxococcota bacterium]|nr:acyl-ACP--UDP-N-acetylglucosamine O-acyltransferase [Myxococcota bacterium]
MTEKGSMELRVHPWAMIERTATLELGAQIGAFSVIGDAVSLGRHVRVASHVVLEGPARIGDGSYIAPFASVGLPAQVRETSGERCAGVQLGERCSIREQVSIHASTGLRPTTLGNDCLLMVGSHVAHDCVLGERVSVANRVMLAGHVAVGDDVVIGGGAAVQQHVRIGRVAFLAGGAMLERDLPPFCRAAGDRARMCGLNKVGLRRVGIDGDALRGLELAYRWLFRDDRPLAEAMRRVTQELGEQPLVQELLSFVQSSRGICR